MEKHEFEITEKIEVTFPHYRKYEFFYHKVLTPTKEIRMRYYDTEFDTFASIEYMDIIFANTFIKGSYEITEEEFNETMARAYQLILNKNN